MAREKYPSDDVDRLMVRFPPGMRDRIAKVAKQNGRSMNAEIVTRLEASLAQIERMNDSLYVGERPLELDQEFFEGMMSLYERMREKHDGKYGATPPELRRPIAYPLRVKEPEPLRNDELSEEQLREGLEWHRQEREALEAEIRRRAKSSD